MPAALTHLVGTACKQQHRKNRCNPWQRREHANFKVVCDTHAFDDGGQPKTHTIQTHGHGEVDGTHGPHAPAFKDLHHGHMFFIAFLFFNALLQKITLFIFQPFGAGDAVI